MRSGLPWLLGGLLACVGDPSTGGTPAARSPDPSLPGPHAVGYRETSVSWSGGLQVEPRELGVAAWFPTDATTGDPVTYQGFVPAEGVLGGVEPTPGPLPLAVFSHGHQAYAEAASFLAAHLASHGWLVLAPDHTGNTTWDPADRPTEIYWQRPLDVSAVLDEALAGLVAPVAPDRVIAIGHSFGGYTIHADGGARYDIDTLAPACFDGTDSSAFCSTMTEDQADVFRAGLGDPRFRALIAMAPGDWRLYGDGLADIDVPELLMTGGEDGSVGSDGDPIWSDLDGPDDLRVHLPTGGHNAFTDFSGALDPTATLDPEEGWRIVRTYALLFAERWTGGALDDDAEALLAGETTLSDEAEVTHR